MAHATETVGSPVVMVSGANRGIGLAVARRLRREGYHLSLGVRNTESVSGLPWCDDEVLIHRWDALEREAGAQWVAATVDRFGRLDAVVNNAGVLYPFDVENDDESLLDEMWAVNVKAPLRIIRAAFPYLKASGSGRVVNIASLSGKRVKSGSIAGYSMTKHALAALTHSVRYSGWEHGIRATSICPGLVATDMTADVVMTDGGPMIDPESIAELLVTVLRLPNHASVAELPINCILEHSY